MPDGTPAELFVETFESVRRADPRAIRETTLAIGGRGVRVRVAGERLAALLDRSFAPGDPEALRGLRLDLWDESATSVGSPAGNRRNLVPGRGGLAGDEIATSADGRTVRYAGPHFDIRLERDARRATGWVRSPDHIPSWNRARPLQSLLMPWLIDLGMVAVHAAMVARGSEGVVLVGPSMAGKSTTAAVCAHHGLAVLGDDAIAVERRGEGFDGHCLHAAVKLRCEGLARTPALAGRVEPMSWPWKDEAVLFLRDVFPSAVQASAHVRALAFPRRVDARESRAVPMSRGRALATLTGSALSVERGAIAPAFALLAEMAERLPVLRIDVGTDTDGIPAVIDDVLRLAAGS